MLKIACIKESLNLLASCFLSYDDSLSFINAFGPQFNILKILKHST